MIYLSIPSIRGNEWKYIKECLDTEWVSSAGKYVNLFEDKIAEYTGSKYAIACTNGTAALHLSLLLAGVQPGDEVIVPTLTFIASINVVRYCGAEPVFMDADEYYNIDTEKAIRFIKQETVFKDGFPHNKRTNARISAILPVHVFGNAAWLDDLMPLCEELNIAVVEDAAESIGTRYTAGMFSGKHTGTVGKLGCLSFNGNKIITTGGGGMILTDSAELAEKAKYLSTQAKDDHVRFIHDEMGYNFRLPNVLAAMGVAQLEQLPEFLERKKAIYNHYVDAVKKIEGLQIAPVPTYSDNNHWSDLLKINKAVYRRDRETLMADLLKDGIETRPVWHSNHLQKPYRHCLAWRIEKAIELVEWSLCLPASVGISKNEIDQVIKALSGGCVKL
jgi:aminotransferase in exopolysaccharide biosynthesis